ncbi:MAG: MBL fold metallo-hydrolase [Kofleriaceae bacterium]
MEPHLNALSQVTLSLGRVTVSGFSISGLATYVQIPELDVCFDMGECPLSSLSLNHVLLTHAHGDHARCLPRHWQLRRMVGNLKPAAYFLPEEIRAGCEGWIRAEAAFEGVPDEVVETPDLRGLVAGPDVHELPHRKDLRVRAFSVTHSVPSLGYTILAHKRKLLPEYRELPGPQIAKLRKEGVDVNQDVYDPLVTFIGDCVGQSLLDEAHIWQSPIVILECTFLEPGEEGLAAKKLHTHLVDIARALEELGERVTAQHIVLKHFSMRYKREEVMRLVEAGIPDRFRDRIRILL